MFLLLAYYYIILIVHCSIIKLRYYNTIPGNIVMTLGVSVYLYMRVFL